MFGDIVWYLDVFGMFAVCVFLKRCPSLTMCMIKLEIVIADCPRNRVLLVFRRYLIVKDAYFITPLESRKTNSFLRFTSSFKIGGIL